MATPTFSNVPTTISTAESTTGWAGTSVILDPDIRREGANSIASTLRGNNSTTIYSGANLPANLNNQTIRMWCTNSLTPYMNSFATEGFSLLLNTGSLGYYTVAGFDTYNGGWLNIAVSTNKPPTSGTVTPTNNVSQIGVRFRRTSAPRNINNTWLDYLRYGDGYTVSGGTSSDPITPVEMAVADSTSGYGIFERKDGVIFGAGTLSIGVSGVTDFQSVGDLFVFVENPYTRAGLYGIEVNPASGSTTVLFDGSVIKSAGTLVDNRFVINCPNSNYDVTFTGCLLVNSADITMAASHTMTNNTLSGCGNVRTNGCVFTGNVISEPNDIYAVTCPITSMGNLTGNSFESDGSNHAVQILGGAGNFTWDNTLTGYVAGVTGSPITTTTTGSNQALFVNISSGTVTINVAAGATIPSVRSAGAVINVVAGQRTLTVTVRDFVSKSLIENARVLIVADVGGSLAEGTVIIDKVLTNASGQVTDTRSYGSDQPYIGTVRLASSGVFYQAASLSGTISSSANTNLTVQLVPDE